MLMASCDKSTTKIRRLALIAAVKSGHAEPLEYSVVLHIFVLLPHVANQLNHNHSK